MFWSNACVEAPSWRRRMEHVPLPYRSPTFVGISQPGTEIAQQGTKIQAPQAASHNPPPPACSPVEYNPSARSYSTEYESFSFSLIDWQSPLVPPPFPCDSDAFRFNKDNHHHHHPAPRHIISSSPTCLSFIFTFISLVLSSYHATPHSSY